MGGLKNWAIDAGILDTQEDDILSSDIHAYEEKQWNQDSYRKIDQCLLALKELL